MKFVFKIFMLGILALVISGCASYVEPPESPQIATIQGSSSRESLAVWSTANIISIDDKDLGMRWSESSKFNISPGEHQIIVRAAFNRGFSSGGPYYAIIQMPFKAMPGNRYIAKSSPKGIKVSVWIENMANNQIVSVTRSERYQIMPTSSAPIFITQKK